MSEYGNFDLDKIEYNRIWYTFGPSLEKITHSRKYQDVVNSTMVRSNIPECGIFDHGKVEYTGI